MARVYSTLLAAADEVSDSPSLLGEPPAGSLWVVRFIASTFGSFAGYVGMGFSFTGEDPWLWLTQTGVGQYVGVHQFTIVWEGRWVIPAATALYARASDGDTGGVLVSGYTLTVDD